MELERLGTPTATVITEAFRVPARHRASMLGSSGLKIIEMSHPLASRSRDRVELETDQIASSVFSGVLEL